MAGRLAGRLALVLFGLALGIVVAEVGLRLTARFAPGLRGGRSGETTILCVGDSHTYGLHVAWPQSWPAQLQALLDPSAERVGVLNYGVPGRNCARLALELPRYLERTRPDLVLVLVGFNDTWNRDGVEERRGGGWFDSLLARSRLLRFLRLALLREERAAVPDPIEVGEHTLVREDDRTVRGALPRLRPLEGAALRRELSSCLLGVVEIVRRADAEPILLTYAPRGIEPFATINRTIRETARDLGVRLVDLEEALGAPDGGERLLFPDLHPTAAGNERIARAVAERLRAWGLVPRAGGAPPRPLEGRVSLSFRHDPDGRLLAVVTGPPGRPFQVLLSERADPAITFQGVRVPLAATETLARSLESLSLRGTLGPDGTARAPLDPARFAPSPGHPLLAAALVFPPAVTADSPPLVSPPVTVPASGAGAAAPALSPPPGGGG